MIQWVTFCTLLCTSFKNKDYVSGEMPLWLGIKSPGQVGQGEQEIVNEISRGRVNKKALCFILLLDTHILDHLQRRGKAVLLSKITFMPLLSPPQANVHAVVH